MSKPIDIHIDSGAASYPGGDWVIQGQSKMGEDPRVLMVWCGKDTSMQYEESDLDEIVSVFWQHNVNLGLLALPDGTPAQWIIFSLGSPTFAAIKIHRSGEVTAENYEPDEKAMRLWSAIAKAWPIDQTYAKSYHIN